MQQIRERNVAAAPRPLDDDRLSLYLWQAEAFREWITHDHQGVIEAVTGAGKTRLGLAAASEALRTGRRVLLIVPTRELMNQWYGEIRALLPWAIAGRIGDGHRDDLINHEIVVATAQGVLARLGGQPISMVGGLSPGLLIADECHRYAGTEFSRTLDPNAPWRLGLTATFERADELDREVLAPYFGGVIHRLWYDRARDDRLIAPFDIALVGVHLRPEERIAYDDLSDQIRSLHRSLQGYLTERALNAQQFLSLVALWARAEESSARAFQARKYMRAVTARQKLLAKTPAKQECLAMLEPALRAAQRTILFSLTQESAQSSAETLAAVGIRADSIYSDLGKSERSQRMQDFRDGSLPVLAAPRILDEGVDVPEADLGIVLAANRSKRQIVQRLGRVIRRKVDGRAGKFAVFYAIGTLEDPDLAGDEHLNQVLPHARELGYFTLPSDRDELLEFLRNPPASEPVPPPALSAPTRSPEAPPPSVQHAPGPPPEPDVPREWHQPTDAPVTPPTQPDLYEELPDWDGEPPQILDGVADVTADAVKDYLKKIARHKLLTAEEEVELAQKIEAGLFAQERLDTDQTLRRREVRELRMVATEGRRAKAALTSSNLRLVVSIAKKYAGSAGTLDFLDLIQDGNQGLNRAVEKFDYALGHKFSTYATWWIRQSIVRCMADTSRTIRMPVHAVEELRKLKAELDKVRETLDDSEATIATAAKRVGIEPEKAQMLFDSGRAPLSLDREWWVGEDEQLTLGTFGDLVVDEFAEDPTAALENWMLELELSDLFYSLRERDADIVRLRFGLDGLEPLTLDQIGDVYGLTRERIRQIESKTMTKIRRSDRSDRLRGFLNL